MARGGGGGFPEAQGLEERSRRLLLGSYLDITVLRDVIERHAIRQPLALQWMVRQLLGNGGSGFSLNKLHGGLKSQGLVISREHLAEAPCISKEVRSYQRNHQGAQPMNNETDLRRQISW